MRVNEQDFKIKFLVPVIDRQRCLLMKIWKLNDKGAILSLAEGPVSSATMHLYILLAVVYQTVQNHNLLQHRLDSWQSMQKWMGLRRVN